MSIKLLNGKLNWSLCGLKKTKNNSYNRYTSLLKFGNQKFNLTLVLQHITINFITQVSLVRKVRYPRSNTSRDIKIAFTAKDQTNI